MAGACAGRLRLLTVGAVASQYARLQRVGTFPTVYQAVYGLVMDPTMQDLFAYPCIGNRALIHDAF